MELVIKMRNLSMEHKFPSLGSFHRENGTTFSGFRLFRKFPEKVVFYLHPNGNFWIFLVNGKRSVSELWLTILVPWTKWYARNVNFLKKLLRSNEWMITTKVQRAYKSYNSEAREWRYKSDKLTQTNKTEWLKIWSFFKRVSKCS